MFILLNRSLYLTVSGFDLRRGEEGRGEKGREGKERRGKERREVYG